MSMTAQVELRGNALRLDVKGANRATAALVNIAALVVLVIPEVGRILAIGALARRGMILNDFAVRFRGLHGHSPSQHLRCRFYQKNLIASTTIQSTAEPAPTA